MTLSTSAALTATFITLGQTFEIAEPDLQMFLMERIKQVDLKKAEAEIKTRITNTVRNPAPVFLNAKCTKSRTWFYDPTLTVPNDITDHKKRVLIKKGTLYNPLLHRAPSSQLIFIEGTDQAQLDWALAQNGATKIVLVSGSVLACEERYNKPFYFDQGGWLCHKFGIKAFPATVSHHKEQKEKLRCQEREITS
jgi:conjugal transfer pilus assembly protein TraW